MKRESDEEGIFLSHEFALQISAVLEAAPMRNPDHTKFTAAFIEEGLSQGCDELGFWFPRDRLRAFARTLLEAVEFVPQVTSLVPAWEIQQFNRNLKSLLRASMN